MTGNLYIITGNGKGKTTSSVGQSLRAKASGMNVAYITFFKNPEGINEFTLLNELGIKVYHYCRKHPAFEENISKDELRKEFLESIELIIKMTTNNKTDLMVLDEFLVAIRDNIITDDEAADIIDKFDTCEHIFITGRGATSRLKEKAVMVSSIDEIKHHFSSGINAQRGIEF